MKTTCFVLLVALLCGCGDAREKESEAEASPAPSAKKSDSKTLVNGFTGRTAVDKGLEARQIVKEAEASKNRDLEEVLDSE